MRLWLKDSERRPDPAPVATDDRVALCVGLVLWILALVAVLVFSDQRADDRSVWIISTCLIGIVLGALGLLYTKLRRR